MASYAQIAQKSWTVPREDGSSRTYQLTIEQRNGSVQSLEIPLVQDIVVTIGDASDEVNKAIKTHQLQLQLKAESAAGDLISVISDCGHRELRIVLEETTNGYIHFQGYIIADRTEFGLYEKVQSVAVKATGMLNDLATTPAADSTRSFGSFAEDINAALDLDRLLDVYSNLRPSGRSASDILPDYIHFNPHQASGQEDESNITNALQSMLLSTGMQLFQENGRIVLSDIFDRYNNPTLKRYKQTGAGFDVTTRSTRIGLDADNVIRGGRFKALPPIRAYNHNFILNTRANSVFLAQTNADPGTASQSAGMVRAGDVIRLTHYGVANITLDDLNSSTGIITFGALRLEDEASGVTYWYDFDSEEWTTDQFTRETGFDVFSSLSFPVPFGSQTPINLEPVPDGVVGRIHLEMLNGVTTSNGTFALNAPKHNAQINFDSVEPASNLLRHSYTVFSAEAVADEISANFYIADGDKYTASQAFRDGASLIEEWTDGTNTGTLLEIVAERIGQLLIGNRRRFVVQLRDAATISLLNSFSIIDDAAVTHIALPVCIKHNVLRGYYEITCIGRFDVIEQSQEYYAFDVETTPGSGMTGTPSRPPGGGVTDHGLLTGLNHPEHHPWALKTDFSNIQSTGALLAELDAEYLRIGNDLSDLNSVSTARANLGVAIGTDVQAWNVNLDKLATLDGEDLVNLHAGKLAAGTVPNARLSGSYTGITGTGALTTGSIVPGFGDIDIGSKKLTAASLNTGQGDNQLWGMNQDVKKSSDVEFKSIRINSKPFVNSDGILVAQSIKAAAYGRGVQEAFVQHTRFSQANAQDLNEILQAGAYGLGNISWHDNYPVSNSSGYDTLLVLRSAGDVGTQMVIPRDQSASTIAFRGWSNSGSRFTDWKYVWHDKNSNLATVDWAAKKLTLADTLTGVDASFSATLSAATLRTSSGKFLAPVDYQFRNAGDTDYRNLKFKSLEVTGGIKSAGATPGFTGSGFEITNAGKGTLDELLVRGSLRARELIYDQLGAVGGSQLISAARGKIASVNTGSSKITLEDPNNKGITTFKKNDIFWVMAWDVDGASIVSAVGTVTAVSGVTLTLSFTSGAIGDLTAGDVMVQRGNTNDSARQALIYQTASDAGAPFTAYYAGVKSSADFAPAKVIVQTGLLDSLTGLYPAVSGPGLFGANTFLTGKLLAGDLSKTNDYAEYKDGVLTIRGAIHVTGGNAATTDNVSSAISAFAGGLGDLALEDLVSLSKLDGTIISGGYLKTSLINTAAIAVGDLSDGTDYELKANLKAGAYLEGYDKALNGVTLIAGGYISTGLINVDSIIANKSIIVAGDNISDLTNDSGFQTAGNVSSAISAFAGGLGDLALEDLVSLSKLDGTIISGGYIKTSLINTAAIAVGDLSDGTDYALIQDIITSYDDLSGKPSLGDVAKLNSITSTYIANGAVVTAKIAAGSITTVKLATDAIKSLNYSYVSGDYSDAGSLFDLSVGTIRTPEFSVVSGKAKFAGELNSPIGRLGGLNLELEELWGGAAARGQANIVVAAPSQGNPYIGMYGEDGVRTELLAGANPLIALTGVGGIEQVFIGGAFQEEGEEDFRFTGTDFKYGGGSSMGNFSRNTNTHGDYNITDSAGINFQLDKYKGRVLRFKASAMMRVETFGTSNMGFVSVAISLRARKHGAATHKTWDKYDEIVIFDQEAIQTKTFALEVNDVMPEDCDRLEIMVNMTAQHTGTVYIESSFIPAEASGTIVGSSNYIAAQGIQMVSALTGKRFKLDREAGRATVNELVIESADRQTRGIFRIVGNQLRLYKRDGVTQADAWSV